MADESNIILNMPFDEAAGSTIAYDYSKTRADGTVVEADFTGGKQGNCIKFDGNGPLRYRQKRNSPYRELYPACLVEAFSLPGRLYR